MVYCSSVAVFFLQDAILIWAIIKRYKHKDKKAKTKPVELTERERNDFLRLIKKFRNKYVEGPVPQMAMTLSQFCLMIFLGLSMYQEKERMKKQSINSTN